MGFCYLLQLSHPPRTWEIFILIAWAIWRARNLRLFKATSKMTSGVLDMAGRMVFCFQDYNKVEVTPAPPCKVGCLGWLKPPADTLKHNVNAAW